MWSLVQVALLLVGLAVLVLLGALLRPAWSWWATARARPGGPSASAADTAGGAAATSPPEELRARSDDVERRERRLAERESRLDVAERELEIRSRTISATQEALTARQAALADLETERRLVLERAARLTADQARAQLVSSIENEAKREAALTVRELERQARAEGDRRARAIITTVVQRLATEQTTDSVVTTLQLPSDELKGRIIGRDGRNIRAFEQITGVNVIVDETPESVMLSCFDPVRREVGRMTLEHLVLDGRIHPRRIEELYARSLGEVEQTCLRAGEEAVAETGLTDLHPELVRLLGTLRFRTSYGQNVLRHLVESASIAALLAAELGLDPALPKRCGLLHDIGKALTHQAEGSHALVGAELARSHGESAEVVHAIEAHHDEVEPRTVEAVLTQAADAISGGRPGARRESLAAYVQRLERLEEIARSYPGVDTVHAMRSGRDVRVMVVPAEVDDLQAQVLARDIAKRVEAELTYPGQIRVTVIRETRATETAL
ncbi:ribonuclease Y [Actinopolymorpha singaporensis]|uniref:Ribonuclease Y n=1 Tax=Actinopolymorpha singaporensis TaxID=117157 RepID=A0A1H1XRB1_9ACTN|nr:ribonuclease Y [Actinopolymorpha singaporensis]SDT11703.1 ribonucrease Y [Actinopolymorpha singaporensis]